MWRKWGAALREEHSHPEAKWWAGGPEKLAGVLKAGWCLLRAAADWPARLGCTRACVIQQVAPADREMRPIRCGCQSGLKLCQSPATPQPAAKPIGLHRLSSPVPAVWHVKKQSSYSSFHRIPRLVPGKSDVILAV